MEAEVEGPPAYAEEYLTYCDSPYLFQHVPLHSGKSSRCHQGDSSPTSNAGKSGIAPQAFSAAASSFMPQDPQTSVKEEKFEAAVYAEEYLNYGDSPYLFPHVPFEPKVLSPRPEVGHLSEDSGNSSPHRGQALWLAMGRAYHRWIADARRSMA